MSQLTLYGSLTSPFVRRIRILLAKNDYQLKLMNMFDTNDRIKMKKINPLVKIPVLEDGENIIFDSRQIYLYLVKKMKLNGDDSVDENNLLTVIDGTTDSLVTLFYLTKSALVDNKETMIYQFNQKRASSGLKFLNDQWTNRREWKYADICLYSLIDWIQFRNITDLSSYPNLTHFIQSNKNQPFITETAPIDA